MVGLVQHAFRTGETPAAFQAGTLVLIPKNEPGKYRGIALLEALYKLISSIINIRVCTNVKYHDGVHGFREHRSCATAILEVKLEMQLARRQGKVWYQIFLDLSKAYDNLDRERLYTVLEAYGVGPMTIRLLRNAWEGAGVVPKKAGRYGGFIPTERGVKQGDIPSPTFFNLVIDAILRAEAAHRRRQGEQDAVKVKFYADDGAIGSYDPIAVQATLDTLIDLFARMGLTMNGDKTEAMASTTATRPTRWRHGAYQRKLEGTGAEYITRSKEMGECPVCSKPLQKRSLARHLRDQHPGVAPPRLELETLTSPVRRARHLNLAATETLCPDATCGYRAATPAILRRHISFRHPEAEIQYLDGPDYAKCDRCCIQVQVPISARHYGTAACQAGNLRRIARIQQEQAATAVAAPPTFLVGTKQLNMVDEFKYLGRVVACNDSDLAACLRNLARARAKWGEISRVLQRKGASIPTTARFYMVIVSAVLLYGSETWAVTKRMEAMITAFHNRCARTIARTYIRPKVREPDEWVYPSVESSLKAAGLQPLRTYLDRRRVTFREYAEKRPSYQLCMTSNTLAQPAPTLWEQLNQTTIDERDPVFISPFPELP